MLRRTGVPVKPHGAGRRRATADPAAVATLKDLYLRFRLTSGQIASLTGVPERTVRDRLRAEGVTMRSRGGCNRKYRQTVPAEIELLDALYADPMVRRVMARHGLPRVRAMLHRCGVRLRGPGGRSPFLRRWRAHIAQPRTGP